MEVARAEVAKARERVAAQKAVEANTVVKEVKAGAAGRKVGEVTVAAKAVVVATAVVGK